MRHRLGWADLAASRIGVFGAGVEGRAALRRLEGLSNEIVVVDDAEHLVIDGHEVLATSHGGFEALTRCDVVIKSPGISRYRDDVVTLEAAGVAVVGGVGLTLHEVDRTKVICVTGTKGKSTTASVLGHLARGLGQRAEVTGNIGRPPSEVADVTDLDLLVVETSSFQALDVADAPGTVVVTSLAVDHVDWHTSAERYRADKLSLTSLPGAGTTLAQRRSPELVAHEALLGGEVRWVDTLAGPWAGPLGLLGEHNLANASLAAAALDVLGVEGAADLDALEAAAVGYQELPGRLVHVATIHGVRFIDDSLATNVLPTLAALAAFEGERLALLLGGYDRGVDYTELVEVLSRREAPTLVIGLPDSGSRLVAAIESHRSSTETALAATIDEATRLGAGWVGSGGLVLLSPAAPSFSQFASWKERSAAFAETVRSLSRGAT